MRPFVLCADVLGVAFLPRLFRKEGYVMDMSEVLTGGGVALVLLTLVEIAPVKLNPWSWLARALGRAINGEIFAEIGAIKRGMEKLDADLAETRALNSRSRILRFNDELLLKQRHSKEYFDQVLEDITSYQRYCSEHPEFKNEKAVLAIGNVERCYNKCMEEKDFLA